MAKLLTQLAAGPRPKIRGEGFREALELPRASGPRRAAGILVPPDPALCST